MCKGFHFYRLFDKTPSAFFAGQLVVKKRPRSSPWRAASASHSARKADFDMSTGGRLASEGCTEFPCFQNSLVSGISSSCRKFTIKVQRVAFGRTMFEAMLLCGALILSVKKKIETAIGSPKLSARGTTAIVGMTCCHPNLVNGRPESTRIRPLLGCCHSYIAQNGKTSLHGVWEIRAVWVGLGVLGRVLV